jgi:PilZ domain
MDKERRFERVVCNEKVIVHYNDIFMEGRLRNISVNGALVHLNEDMLMQHGEQCLITICLNIFDITLHFLAEVRHSHKNEAGVKFLFMDSDTKIYLKSLLAFRTANPQLISEEFDYSLSYGNSGGIILNSH